jgi:hypothetical protein
MTTRELKDATEIASTTAYGVTKLAASGATTAGLAVQGNDARLTAAADLATHLADASDAHDASAVSYDNTASGLAATEAQAAIDEVAASLGGGGPFQPLDADLTDLAGLVRTRGDLIAGGASGWVRLPRGTAGQRVADDGTDIVHVWDYATFTLLITDGTGAALATGLKAFVFEVPFACEIVSVRLFSVLSGSVVVDLWKTTYASFDGGATHPVAGDKITASAPPTITTAKKAEDTTLTGWSTTLAAGDLLMANVNSATTIQDVSVSLRVRKTA